MGWLLAFWMSGYWHGNTSGSGGTDTPAATSGLSTPGATGTAVSAPTATRAGTSTPSATSGTVTGSEQAGKD